MKKIALLLILSIWGLHAAAQGITRNDDIGRFARVSVEGKMNVEFIRGELSAIEIELSEGGPSDQVLWSVTKDGLSVRLKSGAKGMPTVRITFTRLEQLLVKEAEVIFRSPVVGDLFSGEVSSGAKLTAEFECFDLELRLTNNSVAQISGKARYLTLAASQRSQIDAGELEGMAVWTEALSNSQIVAQGVERFVAETNMGSTILYKGEPRILRTFNKLAGKLGGNVVPAQ